MVERGPAAHPGVVIDASQIHQVQQAGAVFRKDVMDRIDQFGAQPRRETFRRVLLKEKRLLDSVRISLQGKRPVLQVRQNEIGHAIVIVEDIALGVSFAGIEDLLQVGEFQRAAVDLERRFLGAVRQQLTRGGAFPHHLARAHIVAQPQENGRAQTVVRRPVGVFHLADQLRLSPR